MKPSSSYRGAPLTSRRSAARRPRVAHQNNISRGHVCDETPGQEALMEFTSLCWSCVYNLPISQGSVACVYPGSFPSTACCRPSPYLQNTENLWIYITGIRNHSIGQVNEIRALVQGEDLRSGEDWMDIQYTYEQAWLRPHSIVHENFIQSIHFLFVE